MLHFAGKNQRREYHLCNTALSHVTEENYLGVVISKDMKAEKNLARNIKKADKIFGMIGRTFSGFLHEQRHAATTHDSVHRTSS